MRRCGRDAEAEAAAESPSHASRLSGVEKKNLTTHSLAQHWARDWRALALTQVHQKRILKENFKENLDNED